MPLTRKQREVKPLLEAIRTTSFVSDRLFEKLKNPEVKFTPSDCDFLISITKDKLVNYNTKYKNQIEILMSLIDRLYQLKDSLKKSKEENRKRLSCCARLFDCAELFDNEIETIYEIGERGILARDERWNRNSY